MNKPFDLDEIQQSRTRKKPTDQYTSTSVIDFNLQIVTDYDSISSWLLGEVGRTYMVCFLL